MTQRIQIAILAMREKAPLVHNITNFVVMEVNANVLLAAGASPLMAHAEEELDDLIAIASALTLNIGTLDSVWIKAMRKAGKAAKQRGVPVVLDPVGAGASRLRTETALALLDDVHPDILRGNASEIMALAGPILPSVTSASTKGVDSTRASHEAADAALALARHFNCVVSVSGEIDPIVSADRTLLVHGGSLLLTRVTGMGCSASALTAAHAAVADPVTAAAAAMAVMAEAAEIAAPKAQGPGSFLPLFLDALTVLSPENAARRATTA